MRMNFLALAAIILLTGFTQISLNHSPWLGGALVALSVFLVVVHVIRVRRFKRFDDSRKFD